MAETPVFHGDTIMKEIVMFDRETEFDYATRRARQEEVAAINAAGEAAASAHRRLSRLYAARALLVLLDPDPVLLAAE